MIFSALVDSDCDSSNVHVAKLDTSSFLLSHSMCTCASCLLSQYPDEWEIPNSVELTRDSERVSLMRIFS